MVDGEGDSGGLKDLEIGRIGNWERKGCRRCSSPEAYQTPPSCILYQFPEVWHAWLRASSRGALCGWRARRLRALEERS